MSFYNLPGMLKKLEQYQDEARFRHTLGVMYTSAALAMCYGSDVEKAQTAGLLHDCAKCISDSKKMTICIKEKIEISHAEKENPFLLHAKVGAYIAKEKYGIEDSEILGAIRYHTTGKPDMTLLEKIVYVADFIEPWRKKAPRLGELRTLAFQDLDRALYFILKSTLSYLKKHSGSIDETTREAYQYYKQCYLHERTAKTVSPRAWNMECQDKPLLG